MHGDVYVFVDSNYIVDEELLKLQRHAKSVRYLKHDQYDFGSWKYLIRQIGLKKILEYDEIVFANNSVYLINDMSQVFDEFSKSEADFYSPCFVDEHYCGKTLTSAAYLKSFGFNDTNIMMPSFFMIFKRHLFSKQYIHKLFMDVKKENNRLDVCYNYERELTRSILRNNVLHKTSLNTIYNNSYIYTYIAFNMAKTGFPFLKKKALQQVYYDIDFIESRISGILRAIPNEYKQSFSQALKNNGYCPQNTPLCNGQEAAAAEFSTFFSKKSEKNGEKKSRFVTSQGITLTDVFDADYYLLKNPDVKNAKIDPLKHFLDHGWAEGRLFSPWFHLQKLILNYPKISKNEFLFFFDQMGRHIFDYFDAKYYYDNSQDLHDKEFTPLAMLRHYIENGASEDRNPCSWFNAKNYFLKYASLQAQGFNPFFHYLQTAVWNDVNYVKEQSLLASSLKDKISLDILFNVACDTIGGGMLSLDRIAHNLLRYYAEDRDAGVAVSCVPIRNKAVKYSMFKSALPQIQFRFLVEQTDPERVHLMIPEVYAVEFFDQLNSNELHWLHSRASLKITIMNQNQNLLPPPEDVAHRFLRLTTNICISTAHYSYTTQSLANTYGLPVSPLTPVLPKMDVRTHEFKQKKIMVSPDEINPLLSKLTRSDIVAQLAQRLPDYEFITISDFSLNDYLELASQVFFSITFGEGMDGYFIEPVLAGAVSFAVYNPVFFPSSFAEKPTIFANWESLLDEIETMIRDFEADPGLYNQASLILRSEILEIYSDTRSYAELSDILHSKYAFYPNENQGGSLPLDQALPYVNTMIGPGFYAAAHAQGAFILNYGYDFNRSLHDCFIEKMYDIEINAKSKYVLIDAGLDFGLYAIYQRLRHGNIKMIYGFEPIFDVQSVAHDNFCINRITPDMFSVKNICLDNTCATRDAMFMSGFATLSCAMDKHATTIFHEINANDYFSPTSIKPVQMLSASPEISEILQRHPEHHFIIKIDSFGHDINILNDLYTNNLLCYIDMIIVFIRFGNIAQYECYFDKGRFDCEVRRNRDRSLTYFIAKNTSVETYPRS